MSKKKKQAVMGRPPLPEGQLQKKKSFRFRDEIWERLKDIGQGSIKDGILHILQEYDGKSYRD